MRRSALITLVVTALATPGLRAQAPEEGGGLEARVWLDRGDEPVLRSGETVRIFYRTTETAHAAIFRIDTDGRISMVFPQDPSADTRLTGGVDYRLIFPSSPVWRVSEDPGVGYFFMVASPAPLDFSAFPFDPEYGWDLGAVGNVVYEDPYVAIDDYVALLIPDWDTVPYGLDFITYNVGGTHTYPRFLCYDCHDAQPYASWNPYSVPCTSVRVVVWDDPYFYPYYRYSGTRVVVTRPVVTQPRYAVGVRAPGDSYRPLILSRPAPPRVTPGYKESPASRTPTDAARRSEPAPQAQQIAPRPTLQRRPSAPSAPSSRLPVRTPPTSSGRTTPAQPAPDARIVRPTQPPTPSSGTTARPSRPSGAVTPRPSTSTRPGAPPSAPSRPTSQPTAPSRPSVQTRPSARPSAPSRPTAQPSPSARPSAQPAAPSRPSARPAAPSRPSAQPAPQGRPAARPSAPSTSPAPRPAAPSRPTVQPRPTRAGRAPSR